MTDQERLQQFQKQLAKNEYFRHNVLKDLLNAIDDKTGNLNKELNIPRYERDEIYLFEILMVKLEYKVISNEEYYNGLYECFFYKIKIC